MITRNLGRFLFSRLYIKKEVEALEINCPCARLSGMVVLSTEKALLRGHGPYLGFNALLPACENSE